MTNFSELGIKPNRQGFTGDQIKIKKVLNKEISIKGFKIVPSKFSGDCLHLHIELGSIEHVIFTGSIILMDQVKRVPTENFPFKTTIVENNEGFEFT